VRPEKKLRYYPRDCFYEQMHNLYADVHSFCVDIKCKATMQCTDAAKFPWQLSVKLKPTFCASRPSH